jgi:hypothetical protein
MGFATQKSGFDHAKKSKCDYPIARSVLADPENGCGKIGLYPNPDEA